MKNRLLSRLLECLISKEEKMDIINRISMIIMTDNASMELTEDINKSIIDLKKALERERERNTNNKN